MSVTRSPDRTQPRTRDPTTPLRPASCDYSAVYGRSDACDGLKKQFVARDFDQHERAIPVESDLRQRALREIAASQLRGSALDEVVDALLRLHAFIEVLVAREHDVHAVLHEQRLECGSRFDVRPACRRRVVTRTGWASLRRQSSAHSRKPCLRHRTFCSFGLGRKSASFAGRHCRCGAAGV